MLWAAAPVATKMPAPMMAPMPERRELHGAEDAAEAVLALGLFEEEGQGLPRKDLGFGTRIVRHEQDSIRSGFGDPEGDSRG